VNFQSLRYIDPFSFLKSDGHKSVLTLRKNKAIAPLCGDRGLFNGISIADTPSPQPSPARGEGARSGKLTATFLLALSLSACSPKYDWRDVQGGDAPYTVLMPDKPARLSREIQLGQQTVTMHMTAAQIDGVKFAVGAVQMPDATQAQTAIALIKSMLLKNIAGTMTQEKTSVSNVDGKLTLNDEFDAISSDPSLRMAGRLVAHDVWAFEVLVVGPEKAINQDVIDTFLGSFKPIH
jgi:hypothetical protein